MAHYKRRRPRSSGAKVNDYKVIVKRLERKGLRYRWIGSSPGWWNAMEHIRPKRREAAAMERAILRGSDPDDLMWPVGSNKPHSYWY